MTNPDIDDRIDSFLGGADDSGERLDEAERGDTLEDVVGRAHDDWTATVLDLAADALRRDLQGWSLQDVPEGPGDWLGVVFENDENREMELHLWRSGRDHQPGESGAVHVDLREGRDYLDRGETVEYDRTSTVEGAVQDLVEAARKIA